MARQAGFTKVIEEIKNAISQPDFLVSNKQWREWCEFLVSEQEKLARFLADSEAKRVELIKDNVRLRQAGSNPAASHLKEK